jgi:hypothetical protein
MPVPSVETADLLRGADQISEYLFGSVAYVRMVYRLTSEVERELRLPTFRLYGATGPLCALKPSIDAWLRQREEIGRQVVAPPTTNGIRTDP